MDNIVNLSLEVVNPDYLIFKLEPRIFEGLGYYYITIDDVELDLSHYSGFIELVLSN